MALLIELCAPYSHQTVIRMHRYGSVQLLEKKGNYMRIKLEPKDKRKTLIALKMLHHHDYLRLLRLKEQ